MIVLRDDLRIRMRRDLEILETEELAEDLDLLRLALRNPSDAGIR